MNPKTKLILIFLAMFFATQDLMAEKLSLETFFQKPRFAAFQISPNGKEIAALAPIKGRMNVVVIDLETRKPRVVTSITNQDVSGFMWANNKRILFFMDKDGNESFGIFAINTDGRKLRTLVEPPVTQVSGGAAVIRTTSVIDVLEDDEDNVLVTSNKRRAAYPDVYKMNIHSGQLKTVQSNPGKVTGWFTDWDGNVIGAGYQDKLETGFMMVDPQTNEWVEITRTRYDEPSFFPAGLSGDGENGYVNSNITPSGEPRDKAGLYKYNFKTKQFGELIYERDMVDCCSLILNRKKRDMIGIVYTVGIPRQVYLDERWKKVMAGINKAFPDTINAISSMDREEKIGVVVSYSSQQPPQYNLYNFEKNSIEWLADSRPWIKAAEMAETKPIEFTARDGMLLHGYLTLPVGSDGKDLPMIMNPHGGPWVRDNWGFNPEIQFLANRGYAVLQVNFRGSTGFGMEHLNSSKKQWGQAMQNDVTDAVMWAIKEGIADKDRVCIYGASYGGYAAMAGLTFTPDLYRCGINYVGVTDLRLLFKTAPDAWGAGLDQMKDMIGDPKKEKKFLEEWSPSNHADKIKVPVFMAYGLQDPRVNIKHARVMVNAMKENNVSFELMVKKNEGHGYRKQENQYDFYRRMESFLAENLNSGKVENVNP